MSPQEEASMRSEREPRATSANAPRTWAAVATRARLGTVLQSFGISGNLPATAPTATDATADDGEHAFVRGYN